MIYRREIEQKIRDLGLYFPVILLTGARQTGKTTLMKLLFPDMRYVSLDLPSLAEKAEQSPGAFLHNDRSVVMPRTSRWGTTPILSVLFQSLALFQFEVVCRQ